MIISNKNKINHIKIDVSSFKNDTDIVYESDINRIIIKDNIISIFCTVKNEDRLLIQEVIDKDIEYYVYGGHIGNTYKEMNKGMVKFLWIILGSYILIPSVFYGIYSLWTHFFR